MKRWFVALMMVFVGGASAASCAQGSQIDGSDVSSDAGAGGASGAGRGGEGGGEAAQGGGGEAAQGGGGGTSSSGGGGGANPCEGVLCDMPPPKECDGSNLKVYAAVGTCDGGACTYTSSLVDCPFGCNAGQCEGDPCAGVLCNEPAASYCFDADHLRVRDLPGTCDPQDGQCDYTTHDEFCAFGCTNGACDNDPCMGVVCPPKASYCSDANTVVQFDAGQCLDGLPCTYGSTSAGCPNGCLNGQCVACSVDAQCGSGKWCSANQCLPCSSDLHCGASCIACGGATPKCNGASCVECVTSADCGASEVCDAANMCVPFVGCTPPAVACTTGGSQDGGCANAYRISRTDAGTASGFTVNNTYGLCNRANSFTTGNCGGNTGSDAESRLFMRQGETANITLMRGAVTCNIGWAGAISLKIYEAACSPDCTSCPQTCTTIDYCVQNNNQNTNFVAPSDGWYTIVVDSGGPVEDKGGVFYLNVKLTCSGGSCACQ